MQTRTYTESKKRAKEKSRIFNVKTKNGPENTQERPSIVKSANPSLKITDVPLSEYGTGDPHAPEPVEYLSNPNAL